MESPRAGSSPSLRSYHDRHTSELNSSSLVSFTSSRYPPRSPREPPVTIIVPQQEPLAPVTIVVPPSPSSPKRQSRSPPTWPSRRPPQRSQVPENPTVKAFFSYWRALLIFLLIFVPISWIIKYTLPDPQSIKDTLVFVFSFLALIPLGEILGYFVSSVADNGITLVIVIFALVKCNLRIVQTYLVGSIVFNLLVVSGMLSPQFSKTHPEAPIRWRLILQTIGILAVLVPAIYGSLVHNNQVVGTSNTLAISHGIAIILLFIFGFYLSRLYNEGLAGPHYYAVVPIYPGSQPQGFVPPYPGNTSIPMTPVDPPVIPWGSEPEYDTPIIPPFPAGVPVGPPISVLPSGGHLPSGLPFMSPGFSSPPVVPFLPSPPIVPFISTVPTESTDNAMQISTPAAEPLSRAKPASSFMRVPGVVPMPSTSNRPSPSNQVIPSAPPERRPQVSIPISRVYRPPQMSTRSISPEPQVTRLTRKWFGKQSQHRSGRPNPPAVPRMKSYSTNNPMPVTIIRAPLSPPAPLVPSESWEEESRPSVHIHGNPSVRPESRPTSRTSRDSGRRQRRSRTPPPSPPTPLVSSESWEEESRPSVHIPRNPPVRPESWPTSRTSRDPGRRTRRSRTPPTSEPVRRVIHPQIDKESQNIEQDHPIKKWMLMNVAVLIMLIVVTAKWLVDSIDGFLGNADISTEFVGIILLPLIRIARPVTMALNTAVPIDPSSTTILDSGIQITVFILPFTVILAWIIDKPLTLMFDSSESIILFLAAITANYVVQGNYGGVKLNGLITLCLYAIFALVFWFYPGSVLSGALATCH